VRVILSSPAAARGEHVKQWNGVSVQYRQRGKMSARPSCFGMNATNEEKFIYTLSAVQRYEPSNHVHHGIFQGQSSHLSSPIAVLLEATLARLSFRSLPINVLNSTRQTIWPLWVVVLRGNLYSVRNHAIGLRYCVLYFACR
jgi:hypothetical protein